MLQFTLEKRRATPAPTMDEVMVWVVDTGIPRKDASCNTPAAEVSAANPCSKTKQGPAVARLLKEVSQRRAAGGLSVTKVELLCDFDHTRGLYPS